jgi:hypothetical protein
VVAGFSHHRTAIFQKTPMKSSVTPDIPATKATETGPSPLARKTQFILQNHDLQADEGA